MQGWQRGGRRFRRTAVGAAAAIAPRDYLERLVAACRTYDIVLAYDNAYCDITFDGYVAPSIFGGKAHFPAGSMKPLTVVRPV